MKNAVVLLIDGLSPMWIGPYGNTTVETPAFNHLAAGCFLAEHALIESPCLQSTYATVLQGGHGGQTLPNGGTYRSLPDVLRLQGVSSTIVLDEISAQQLPLTNTFDHKIVVPLTSDDSLADAVDQTWLAGFFAEAISTLRDLPRPFLYWMHCPGLRTSWDAPYAFRQALADEEDPAPPTFSRPPSYLLGPHCDPDELLGLSCACGGQIALLDAVLDVFLESFEPLTHDTLLIVAGLRGYPLGQHTVVGDADCRLYTELIQVPLLIRFPDERSGGFRTQALIQMGDVHATLAGWFDVPDTFSPMHFDLARANVEPRATFRQYAVCRTSDETAIRTAYWYSRIRTGTNGGDTAPTCELFVKPDDRWDSNDVAERCPERRADAIQLAGELGQARTVTELRSIVVPASLLRPPE
jgi:hypothetical protein